MTVNRDCFKFAYNINMSASDATSAEMTLYGEIVQDYGKWYKENYPEDKSASDFRREIQKIRDAGATHLLLRINSPGGVCTQAVAMRSILANAGFESITIRIEGLCASAATDIATISGAVVEIAEGSEYMIHNPWLITWGNANDLEKDIEHLRQIERTSRAFYAEKSGQSDEQIKEWMDAETWFTAEDAVKYGFCDKLLKSGETKAMPAAACVTAQQMEVMQHLYKAVPKAITVRKDAPLEKGGTLDGKGLFIPHDEGTELVLPPDVGERFKEALIKAVSNGNPVAGNPTENTIQDKEGKPKMEKEIKDITREELFAENPAVANQIAQDAVAAERQRIQDIDDLTMQGYEEMAATAKADGTSALDFQKQIVKAQREKGKKFLQQRKEELAPTEDVKGGAAEDTDTQTKQKAEEKEINDYADAFANAAADLYDGMGGTMY